MEELRPEELEDLVQELEGESQEEEALSAEVEELLRDLQPDRRYAFRRRAAKELGEVSRSSRQVVEALVEAAQTDSAPAVRAIAEESLRTPVHQEILQEYPDLIQRAQSASREVEKLLRGLGPWSPERTRQDAAEQLGGVGTSSPQIVQALIAACESPSDLLSAAAAKSLRAPVHQEFLQRHPELAAAAESALQQAPDTDWLKGALSGEGKGASVQRRIYPKPRIQERPLLGRLMGVPFVLFGLGALLGAAGGVTQGIDLKVLMLGVFGLVFTYVGLYVIGLDLRELFLALLHRGAWQGQQVTADGRITNRDIVEHEDKYGRVSYTYWITFDFPTTEGLVRLKTRVDERRYSQLKRRQPVKVRYAQEDPRLALLEWEQDW